MILYLCSMKKEEMIALLQQQNSFLQQQLQEANRKADALLVEITSLRSLLECKSEEGIKQKRVIKGLAKNAQNKSDLTSSLRTPRNINLTIFLGKNAKNRAFLV